jgi:hypothetical protein
MTSHHRATKAGVPMFNPNEQSHADQGVVNRKWTAVSSDAHRGVVDESTSRAALIAELRQAVDDYERSSRFFVFGPPGQD